MKKILKILLIVFGVIGIAIFIGIQTDFLIIGTSDFETAEDYQLDSKSYVKNINEYTRYNVEGKIVFLNFFDIFCGPCIKEMPDLNYLANHYKYNDKVKFLTFTSRDSLKIYSFFKDKDIQNDFIFNYNIKGLRTKLKKIYFDGKDLTADAIPLNMLIDSKGNLAYYRNSSIRKEEIESLKTMIDSLLLD